MGKIKVSIIGSCVSREAFTTNNNPDYKKMYEIGPVSFQTSIISFISKQVEKGIIEFPKELSEYKKGVLTSDIYKNIRNEIVQYQPDYLILDLYADVRYGIVKTGDTFITNNPSTLRKTTFYKEKKHDYHIHSNNKFNEFFPIFKEKFAEFITWKNENLPNTKIVLNKFRFTKDYAKGNKLYEFDLNKYPYLDKENNNFEVIEKFLEENYDLRIINNLNVDYIGDGQHPYGVNPWHLEKSYQVNVMNEINKIALSDFVENVFI
ncbi:DUF6270 domain-containing protein [Bacillus sp. AFS055030]|uniref:DUF6270 domain-containing protein n=1 Tax=Bacillus sp. AFS055030 TaxID=2033507 RepID=UPI000BFCE26D|nr:DUF6270 domain-containing protein [Bacillus sp. AFS055030]PGL72939.1 hypothetical protein CN925_01815 [Bacillus sp. AFS055030]